MTTRNRPGIPPKFQKLAAAGLLLATSFALASGHAADAVMAGAVVAAIFGVIMWRRRRQREFLESFVFPSFLLRKLHARRPQLTEAQLDEVARGLKQFFSVCQQARGAYVAMPSEAADALWHEFILHTRGYQAFCGGAFGRLLHHQPAEAMPHSGAKAEAGLRRAWKLACGLESIDARVPARLPLLFALDARLDWPGGHRYDAQELAARGARYKKGADGQPCLTGCGSGCGSGSSHGDGGSDGGGDGGGGGGCGGGGCGGGD